MTSVTLNGIPVPQGITFTDNGDNSATISLSNQLPPGTYRIDLSASNTFGSATQTLLVAIKP